MTQCTFDIFLVNNENANHYILLLYFPYKKLYILDAGYFYYTENYFTILEVDISYVLYYINHCDVPKLIRLHTW